VHACSRACPAGFPARHAGAPAAQEEVLLLGWGVPMPLPVRSRRYDDNFWKELFGATGKRSQAQNLKDLGF